MSNAFPSREGLLWSCSAGGSLALILCPASMPWMFLLGGLIGGVLLGFNAPQYVVFPGNMVIVFILMTILIRVLVYLRPRWTR